MIPDDEVKRPNTVSTYTKKEAQELAKCTVDPFFFFDRFVKIQHPTKGALPFKLYPFQHEMLEAFHENRFSIGMTSRQMGKCSTHETCIIKDGDVEQIGNLVKLRIRDRIVNYLEKKLLSITINS